MSSGAKLIHNDFPEIALELPLRIDGAMKLGAEQVASDAERKVPVEEGDLRDDIHVDKRGIGEYAVVAGSKQGAFYGHMVENGTSHSAPHPFLVPALLENVDNIVRLAKDAL